MNGVTILDGGMGKELERIGAPFRQPEWSALALMEDPEYVRMAHQNFVDAGAEVIITNTYAVVPHHIGQERFDILANDLAGLAGRIAREVADVAPRQVRVAGSLPPLFGSYAPNAFDPEAAPALWRVLIDALDPWVDLWVGETIGSIAEFRAIHALLEHDDRPIWASFAVADHTVDGQAQLRTGETMSDIAETAGPMCDAILFNCSQPEVITSAIPALAAQLGGRDISIPFGAYGNAFAADAVEGDTYRSNERVLAVRDDLDPTRYSEIVAGWIADGATLIGGCCGIYPDHIAELRGRFGR